MAAVCCECLYWDVLVAKPDNTKIITVCWDDMLQPTEVITGVQWHSQGDIVLVGPETVDEKSASMMITSEESGDELSCSAYTSLDQYDRRVILFTKG